MGRSYDDLFTFIQEAGEDGIDDIPDFDPGDTDMPTEDAQAAPPADDIGNNGSDTDLPPEMNDGGDDTFNFNMDGDEGGDNNDTTDEAGGEDATEDDATENELGTRTNDILNERLYRRLTERNGEIENTIEQIQAVLVALPYNTVKDIDRPLNQLKTALAKGQSYAIDNFINAEYGVNLLFFEKLNSCYILIEDTIDGILKKASKTEDNK